MNVAYKLRDQGLGNMLENDSTGFNDDNTRLVAQSIIQTSQSLKVLNNDCRHL